MKRLAVGLLGLPAVILLGLGVVLLIGGLLGNNAWGFATAFAIFGLLMILVGAALVGLARAVAKDRVPPQIALGIVGLVAAAGVLGFIFLVPPAPDPCPAGVTGAGTGGWTTTGSMATRRMRAAAALLRDGRVLVAGGVAGAICGDLYSAELYDPKTETWSSTGDSANEYVDHEPALVLSDGRVLVVGVRAELYDPSTGTWAATATMAEERNGRGAAVRLRDGRVLVAGGIGLDSASRSSSEVYDPLTGQWASTGSMGDARSDAPAAVLLQDGHVLVAGGFVRLKGPLISAELYDPASGTWSRTGDMAAAMSPPMVGVPLQDGRVLVVGEQIAQLFDPATGTWTLTTSPTVGQGGGVVVALADGHVLVAGGSGSGSDDPIAAAELYDPATGAWTPAGRMGAARSWASAVLLSDGRVLVVGGADYKSAELYDPGNNAG